MDTKNLKSGGNNDSVTAGEGEPLVLGENLEISDAGSLLGKLQTVAEVKSGIVIDGSHIKVIDTAILQLLAALFRQMQQSGIQISWQQPSRNLCDTAALLGLEEHLCLLSGKL